MNLPKAVRDVPAIGDRTSKVRAVYHRAADEYKPPKTADFGVWKGVKGVGDLRFKISEHGRSHPTPPFCPPFVRGDGVRELVLAARIVPSLALGVRTVRFLTGAALTGPLACGRNHVRTRSRSTMAKVPNTKIGIQAGRAEAVSERMFWATKVAT